MMNYANVLKPHSASIQRTAQPSLKQLLRYVVKPDDGSDHWLWKTDLNGLKRRRFNEHGQAVLSWRPDAKHTRGIFVVARLLLHYLRGPYPRRAVFDLRCGFSGCVNPDHWMWRQPPPTYRLVPTEGGWRVAQLRDNALVKRSLLLSVRGPDSVVHFLASTAVPVERLHAVCGRLIDPDMSVVLSTGFIPTCLECL